MFRLLFKSNRSFYTSLLDTSTLLVSFILVDLLDPDSLAHLVCQILNSHFCLVIFLAKMHNLFHKLDAFRHTMRFETKAELGMLKFDFLMEREFTWNVEHLQILLTFYDLELPLIRLLLNFLRSLIDFLFFVRLIDQLDHFLSS